MTPTGRIDHGDPETERLRSAALTVLHRRLRVVQDFPVPGVLFRDITPVLADPEGLRSTVTALAGLAGPFDVVAGIDARGFLIGGALAALSGTGVIAVRKAGKLAGTVLGEDYSLEYGTARLEVHPDDVPAGASVLVVDDVLATGGTAAAAVRLLRRAGAGQVSVAMMIELTDLGGRALLPPDVAFSALIAL